MKFPDERRCKIKFKAVIFDLDGTLLDTLDDLSDSMNATLAALGFPTHPKEQYRYFVGNGVDTLARRVLPKDKLTPEIIKKCLTLQRENYASWWDKKTRPYPGIEKMLADIENLGLPKAVLSNKSDDFTKLTVAKLLPDCNFDIILGVKDGVPKKPDPTAALDIACQINIAPNEILYLGDTDTDMQTANSAGMYAVGVLWGFRQADELLANGAKILIESPAQVIDILKG